MKKTLIVLVIFFIFQPILLIGQGTQAGDLFSTLERAFEQIENPPTPEDEYFIGRAVAANILETYQLYTASPELVNYLNLICQALIVNSSHPLTFNGYHVSILNSRELNAFATPGGHIFITKGLIETASSEDALAGIIAHELAHIALRHGMKMIDEAGFLSELDLIAQRAGAFSGNSGQRVLEFRSSINDLVNTMVINGYSVSQELEADTTALELLSAAGYSVNGLLEMLRILQRDQHNQRGGFFSTHPDPAQRIANIERQMTAHRAPDTSLYRANRFRSIMGIAQ